MTECCGNPVCSVSVFFLRFRATSKPSFPRRRESRPSGGGNIQRLAEALEILDSRFHGNDERLRKSREWRSFRRHRPPAPSFPHKRESKPLGSSSLKGYKRLVIPTKVGIQTCRHGNLSDKTVSSTLRSRFPLSRE